MRKPRLFVGSSSRAKLLAEALGRRIPKNQYDVSLWWEKTFGLGDETLSALIKECTQCDFAIILFTLDDSLQKGDGEHLKARDNCVFEAGLFIGGLGLDPHRCFLVSSVPKKDLPSDLQGLTYCPMEEPPSLDSPNACSDAVGHPAWLIMQNLEKSTLYERPEVPLISLGELLQRERIIRDGGLLRGGAVVVNSANPYEMEYSIAIQIKKNMNNGITYHYFLPADTTAAYDICRTIYMISLAGLVGKNKDPGYEDGRKILQDEAETVKKNLKTLTMDDQRLRMHFLPLRAPVEFCIHNALSGDERAIYLRYYPSRTLQKDERIRYFVPWCEGRPYEAGLLVKDLLDSRIEPYERVIFRSTKNCDIYCDDYTSFRNALRGHICELFPKEEEIQKTVEDLCFAKKDW